MAYFLALGTASAFAIYGAVTMDMKRRAQAPATDDIGDQKPPYQGVWEPFSKMSQAPTRGRFKKVREATDVLGARVFLVDYGTGAQTLQYHDPREVF